MEVGDGDLGSGDEPEALPLHSIRLVRELGKLPRPRHRIASHEVRDPKLLVSVLVSVGHLGRN